MLLWRCNMIKIGDLAKICNVSTQTLRYYDTEGLLKPDITDPATGYRFYSHEAVYKYKQILFYKNLNFSLDEIKILQSATEKQICNMLKNQKEELSRSINKFAKLIKTIDDILENKTANTLFDELIHLPFQNDPEVIGKWRLCGMLIDENDLSSLENISSDVADDEIIFMPGGAIAWKYFWTKGTLYRICPKYKFAIPNTYKTVDIDNSKYMIIQYMSNDCIDFGKDSIMLLYRQINNTAHTEHQIRPNVDKTDLPFVEDESVLGEWLVVDYIPEISDFNSDKRFCKADDLYTLKICFLSRGICIKTFKTTNNATNVLRYTKGYVINDSNLTTEEYQIKTVRDNEYLFVQHKSGDYIYGGIKPYWYVFKRKDK